MIKILNRGYKIITNQGQTKDSDAHTNSPNLKNEKVQKQLWPPKTKLFVEQMKREKDDPASMYYRPITSHSLKANTLLSHRNVPATARRNLPITTTSSTSLIGSLFITW